MKIKKETQGMVYVRVAIVLMLFVSGSLRGGVYTFYKDGKGDFLC